MSDQKVDKRLQEIEDEIVLLSGHLSEAVEKKLGGVIGDLKDGMEKFQKSTLAAPPQKGAPAAQSVDLSGLRDELDSIRAGIGSKEFKADDDNLAKRLKTTSDTIMKELTGLGKNLRAIPTPEGAPPAPIIELDKLQNDVEELLNKIGSDKIESDIGTLTQRLNAVSDDIMKGFEGLEKTVQNVEKQTGINQDEIKNTLTENLTTLNEAIDTVRTTLAIEPEQTLGAEITEIKGGIGNLSGELSEQSAKVLDSLSQIEKNVRNAVDTNGDRQEESRKLLIENLGSLNEVAESIRSMLTAGEDTTVGAEIIEIKNHINLLTEDLSNSSDAIREDLAALDSGIREIDAIKNRIDELSEELSAGAESAREGFAAIDSGLKEISTVNNKIGELSGEVTAGTGTVREDIAALDSTIKNVMDNTAAQNDELKSVLQTEVGKLNDNTEIIRRMVTTDEEKFLGSLATRIHETVGKLSEDLPDLAGQINNRLVNIFKNAQDNAEQDLAKQEEIKKVLLYDLYKLNETSDAILQMCTTEEDRPLGGEVIAMSDRVEQIADHMPNITEKVNNHSAQLDKISSEVMRMRWFVVGAVAISLIVLIASFFFGSSLR